MTIYLTKKTPWYGLMVWVYAVAWGSAAPAPMTLERAVRLALTNNPNMEVSAARKEAAMSRSDQLRLWQNPEFDLSVEDMPARSSGWSSSKKMIGISQSIPYPGKKRIDREIGTADVMVGEADWRQQRAELVRDVKIAFFRVLTAEREAQVSADLVGLAESSAEASKKRAAAGDTALQEELRAEIQMEQSKADLAEAKESVIEARQMLALMIGVPSTDITNLSGSLSESGASSALDCRPDGWLASHPAMLAARAKCRFAEATTRRARVDHLPDPRVGVSAGHDAAANEDLVELRLSIPLPFADAGKAKVRQSAAAEREAEAELVATEQRLVAEWRSAGSRFKSAASQVTAYRERVLPKSEKALALVKSGFEEGKFGFIDLLDVQRTTAETRLAYQKKLFELNAARAELESFSAPDLTK